MRAPASYIHDHLVWDTRGNVWAVFNVSPASSVLRTPQDLPKVHARLQRMLMALPAESAMWSVCHDIDADDVAQRMISGVDIERHRAFAASALHALHFLRGFRLLAHRYYIAVKLPGRPSALGDLRAVARAAADDVGRAFGLVPPPRRGRLLRAALTAAALIEQKLRTSVDVEPAAASEICWLYARAARRGLGEPTFDMWKRPDGTADRTRLIRLGESTVIAQGGRGDRPYLRVDTPSGTSYQTFAVVSDNPRAFLFRGGAGGWFARLENLLFPVEWYARVRAVANENAQAGSELQVSIVFTTWADSLRELEASADLLRDTFAPSECGLHRPGTRGLPLRYSRPAGDQEALYYATMPTGPTAAVIGNHTQFMLPGDFAAGLPFTSNAAGDPRGALLGYRLDSQTLDPVLFDAAYGPQIDRSGSIGFCGGPGSGKSYTIKRIAAETLAMGGQLVILDRTALREYTRFAMAAPGTAQIVEITPDAPISLDPLRVFAPAVARAYTIGFLALLAGCNPTSDEGALLAGAVDVLLEEPRPALPDVIDLLCDDRDRMAQQVGRRLQVCARNRLAALTFHDRPALDVDADCVVFSLGGLSLPSEQQMRDHNPASGMLPEQAFSQALLYLIAAFARIAVCADTGRFAAMLIDGTDALRTSPQGRELLTEMVTACPENNAALWVSSQQASDIDGTLAELLGNRFAFRQDSHAAAANAAEFIGLQPTQDLIDEMQQLEPGQALYRDLRGRVAPIQVIQALDDDHHVAFDTHPGGDDRDGGEEVGGRAVAMPRAERTTLVSLGIVPLEDRSGVITLPRVLDVGATQHLVDVLHTDCRDGPVLIVCPSGADALTLRRLCMACTAADHGKVGVVVTGLPPIGARVLMSQARELLDNGGTAGWVHAALGDLERRYTTFAVLANVRGLSHPGPGLGQHVVSLVPGTGFVAVTHPAPGVRRIRPGRPLELAVPPGPSSAVIAEASGGIDRLRAAVLDSMPNELHRVESDPTASLFWGTPRYIEVAWYPRLTADRRAELTSSIRLWRCGWCGGLVAASPCPFCVMVREGAVTERTEQFA
jgi:hypothetical protein